VRDGKKETSQRREGGRKEELKERKMVGKKRGSKGK
jgi:hypothetical protein